LAKSSRKSKAHYAKGNGGDDATTNRERNEKLRANTDAAIVFGGGGPLGDVLV
jgi:hypothetical protein